ncbi:folate-binding protein YgfZ [Nitrosovibrio sp. Nv17]|uniref:CAF17-like 4Fe-4S cluster assembly/insertion protein YgfZ n=1 Tax=Nitrosovibrio sp. Nv17 TaxID=1855339 RepID=UPI000908B703|nr:folate-binding protein YgfZ [Nitrosovibrio sp. Nv17]SFW32765.1 hypothetical protein SAMN05216414_11746 [Nitrosovibrio sp. Nv17]
MNAAWLSFLQDQGAIIREDRVAEYGDASAEGAAAGSNAVVLADLSHHGLIRFAGDDAKSFLQGQVSCDIDAIQPSAGHARALHGGYCTPKGRMLASFLAWHDGSGYLMQLPSALVAAMLGRLSRYVMRARVGLTDHSDACVRIGVAGASAADLLQQALGGIPESPMEVIHVSGGSILRLAQQRFEAVLAGDRAPAAWERLAGLGGRPVGAACWDWLEIRAGIPVIVPATQEQFVPQMVNLDAIGGISFRKGCYPGQEIVARTHYLGRVKRRMALAHIDVPPGAVVAAADTLFSADTGSQPGGMIVNAAPAPGGGFDALGVVQTTSLESGTVRWGAPDGPPLEFIPLPYPVSSPADGS